MAVELPPEPGQAHEALMQTVAAARSTVQGGKHHSVEEVGLSKMFVTECMSEDSGAQLEMRSRKIYGAEGAIEEVITLYGKDTATLPDGSAVTTWARLEWAADNPARLLGSCAGVAVQHMHKSGRWLLEAERDDHYLFIEPELPRAMIADVAGQIATAHTADSVRQAA